ncbi:hypothetical protein [Lysobacter sp. HA18]
MEEDLQQLVAKCSAPYATNPLSEAEISRFCGEHAVSRQDFFAAFAGLVAKEFAGGVLPFWSGNHAMNALGGAALEELEGFSLAIFYAFDHGEYLEDGDPEGTIPWQRYTLPHVMEELASAGLSPST